MTRQILKIACFLISLSLGVILALAVYFCETSVSTRVYTAGNDFYTISRYGSIYQVIHFREPAQGRVALEYVSSVASCSRWVLWLIVSGLWFVSLFCLATTRRTRGKRTRGFSVIQTGSG